MLTFKKWLYVHVLLLFHLNLLIPPISDEHKNGMIFWGKKEEQLLQTPSPKPRDNFPKNLQIRSFPLCCLLNLRALCAPIPSPTFIWLGQMLWWVFPAFPTACMHSKITTNNPKWNLLGSFQALRAQNSHFTLCWTYQMQT